MDGIGTAAIFSLCKRVSLSLTHSKSYFLSLSPTNHSAHPRLRIFTYTELYLSVCVCLFIVTTGYYVPTGYYVNIPKEKVEFLVRGHNEPACGRSVFVVPFIALTLLSFLQLS